MIDDERAAQWAKDEGTALTRNLDKNTETAHLASILLALLADREGREQYVPEQR
jgi:hypothetical protein